MNEIEVSIGQDGEKKKMGKRGRKIFWGMVLVFGTIALLANKLGYLGGSGFWSIAISIVLAAIFIDGMIKRSFGEMLFSIAFFIIANDEMLGLEAITPWPVLLAACALTIGLKMLFPRFGKRHHILINGKSAKTVSTENREGSSVYYENAFGSTVKYITGEVSEVNMENSFGGIEVYFSDAVLVNNTARVHVESSFGGVELYVPSDWKVMMNVDTSFGAAEETGHCNPSGENTLYVEGEVSFGGLDIKYI